jgi:hypothetical protein
MRSGGAAHVARDARNDGLLDEVATRGYLAGMRDNEILAAWIRDGIVTPPVRKRSPLPASPVRLPVGTAGRVLDQDRDEST